MLERTSLKTGRLIGKDGKDRLAARSELKEDKNSTAGTIKLSLQ